MEDSPNLSGDALTNLVLAVDVLESRMDNFRLRGPNVSGNLRTGFIVSEGASLGGQDQSSIIPPSFIATGIISTSPTPPIPTGHAFTLAIVLTGTAGTPTGTVSLTIGSFTGGATALVGGGASWLVSGQTPKGTYLATVTYSGDVNYIPQVYTANIDIHTVPTVVVTTSPDPPPAFSTFTVTITVSGVSGVPTGTATMTFNGIVGATQVLDGSGQATWTVFNQPPGTYVVEADYGGDSAYQALTTFTNVTMGPATPTANLNISPNPAPHGFPVFIDCIVFHVSTGPPPSGNIQIFPGGAIETLSPNITGDGEFSFIQSFAIGTYNINFNYLGDTVYNPAISNTVVLVVT